MNRHVVLVGMMGVGKSTVGRMVATQLQRPFVDTDTRIEEAEGCPISAIFADKGEPYFRARELETIRIALGETPAVISIGGGAFVNPAVRELFRDSATTFYLQASAETLIKRVGSGATRPLLNGTGSAEELEQRLRRLLSEREPIYTLADFIVETDGLDSAQVTEAIVGYRSYFTE